MNKTLFNYCQKHLRLIDSAQLKPNASLTQLANTYNIGYINQGIYYFTPRDKQLLVEVVAQQLNGLRLSDAYPERQTRTAIAKISRNEKIGALKVSEDFVLLNSLDNLMLNSEVISQGSINGLGHFLCASEIVSIEHPQIILVENLIVMANLQRLNIPESLKSALWLYRGDSQPQQHTSTANQFFKRFTNSNDLICFSDLDPSGIQIALTCGATHWLSLNSLSDMNIKLTGIEHEWFKQKNAIQFINGHSQLSDEVVALFSVMSVNQKTLKQEHILEHQLPLKLYSLI